MSVVPRTVKVIQRLIRGSINRLWIKPIEKLIIPRLTAEKPNRAQRFLLEVSLWCADAGRVLLAELRLKVIRWRGPDWCATYVGDGFSAEVLEHVLFLEPPETRENFKAYLWQVPGLVHKLVGEGDLVVCELSRIIRLSNKDIKWSFTTPQWVKQVIDRIDRPVDELYANFDKQTRSRIRRLESQNYNYRTTDSEADFELFYHRMYLPYIEARHGGRGAIIRSYDYVHSYFEKGVLLMVQRDGELVCGSIFQLKGLSCVGAQMGVIDGRVELVKQDSNVAMWWYILNWAHQHGAQRFDLGGSRPMMSDGAFIFKRQWGSKVIRYHEIYSQWNFFANDLPEKLRDHLNQQGFICEISGDHYQVMLLDTNNSIQGNHFIHRFNALAKYGLSGFLTINANGEQRLLRQGADIPGIDEAIPHEVQRVTSL